MLHFTDTSSSPARFNQTLCPPAGRQLLGSSLLAGRRASRSQYHQTRSGDARPDRRRYVQRRAVVYRTLKTRAETGR